MDNYTTPNVDLDGPQVGGGLDTTYFDHVSFTGTKVSRTHQTVSFDWGIGPHSKQPIEVDAWSH